MKLPAKSWAAIFTACGVWSAQRDTWSPIFADLIGDNSFSKGPSELPPFLANVLHETGRLRRLEENLNYSEARIKEVGYGFPPGSRWRRAAEQAAALAGNPEALAEVLYGGRFGNSHPGDGLRYRGRGPGQITFHDNYARVGDIVGQDLIGVPDLAAMPHFALEIFLGWWEDKVPDAYIGNDALVRRVVQGGTMGLAEVSAFTRTIEKALRELEL